MTGKSPYVKPELTQTKVETKKDICAGLLDYMSEEDIKDMQYRRSSGEDISGGDYWPGNPSKPKKWWE